MIGNWRQPLAVFVRAVTLTAGFALCFGAFFVPPAAGNDTSLHVFAGGLFSLILAIYAPRAIAHEPEPRPLYPEEE